VARRKEGRYFYFFHVGGSNAKDHWEDIGVDVFITLDGL